MGLSDDIIQCLMRTQAQRDLADKMGKLQAVKNLQHWQCKRLLRTHDDMAKMPEYQQAMAFFVEELYGPKDFSQRDADLVRVIPKLAAMLPNAALSALYDAVNVNALSFDLDLDLVQHLQGDLNAYQYASAYRRMGRLEERAKQIDIIYDLGEQLAGVINIPGVSFLIKIARKPAELAGVLALHEFLERGFHAFRKIGDVDGFIDPVLSKERDIMYRLHSPECDLDKHNPIPEVL